MSDDPRRRLGRGVIVDAGAPVPEGWDGAERISIDDAVLAAPTDALDRLHRAWTRREPVVVDLGLDAGLLRTPETETAPAVRARARLRVRARAPVLPRPLQQLRRATRSARVGSGVVAAALGAREGGAADVLLPDGTPAWLDGGPRVGAVPRAPAARSCTASGSSTASDARHRRADRRTTSRPTSSQPSLHSGGPARIIAPAGSGKTRVLTERFRLLVAGGAGDRGAVCAVAYNVRGQGGDGAAPRRPRPAGLRKVRTLHALGYDILRRARAIARRDRRVGRPAPHRAARPGAAARQHRRLRAVPRSARRGAARARRRRSTSSRSATTSRDSRRCSTRTATGCAPTR